MELELKLLLDPAARSMVEQHPVFAEAAEAKERHEKTVYFDTPELALRRRGASLRVRQSGGRCIQTMKLEAPGDGLGVRGEWEWPLASRKPDLSKLGELRHDVALPADLLERVRPLFSTDIKRKVWQLELDAATMVEAVIDQGMVRAGRRRSPICEVELELKGGPSAPLFRLAIELADHAALRYGSQSKAERGYALLANGAVPRPEPEPVALARGIAVGKAIPHLLNAALQEFAAEMAGAARGDVEGVHRLRAAIRKLRTLLVLFRPYLDDGATRRFNASLRDFGVILGEGRDWDVFVTETLPEAAKDTETAAPHLLAAPAEERRAAAHAAIAEAMLTPRLTGLILGMGAWVAQPGWLRKADPEARLCDLLPHLMDRLERKVHKRAKHLVGSSAEDLHDLRKSLKKLRYAAEDIGALFARKAVHRYLRPIKSVLKLLGDINDAAVTMRRIDEIARKDRPDLVSAATAALAWNERRRVAAMGKLSGKVRKFRASKPFWA